jgi:hypothetical protein
MAIAKQEIAWPTTWEGAEALARRITDRIGCPIDNGILETVVVLNLLGLRTCASCEGHLDYGTPYPWIDFETDEFPSFKQALEDADREELNAEEREEKGAQLVALAATLAPSRLQIRLEELLDTYYQQCPQSEDWRVIVRCMHPGYYRMVPDCGYLADEWPHGEPAEYLARAQVEMRAFTVFLKQRFFRCGEIDAHKREECAWVPQKRS